MKENNGEGARTAWLGSFMRLSKSKRYFKDLLDVIKVRQLAVEIKVRDIINRTDSSMFMIYPQEILDYAKKPTVSEEQIEGYIIGKLGGKKQERENRGWFISQYGPNRTTLTAAAAPTVSKSSKVYEVVEEMPSFPGGKPAIAAYIAKTVKYPGPCFDNKIQGRVVCRFTVTKEGTVKDIVVTKSVDPLLDKEAIRVISLMPRWIPGKHNGARVDAKYTLPVTFRLTQTADEDN
jgi:TonB family protein